MTPQSRYYIDDQGREWFAVCLQGGAEAYRILKETDEEILQIKAMPGVKSAVFFVPIDQVQITDALACSRSELGPVYVVRVLTVNGKEIRRSVPKELLAVVEGKVVTTAGIFWNKRELATLAELKGAGIE